MNDNTTSTANSKELAREIDSIAIQIIRKATESMQTRCIRCNDIAKVFLKITLLLSVIIYVIINYTNRSLPTLSWHSYFPPQQNANEEHTYSV